MAMITADPKDVPQVPSFAFTPENLAKATVAAASVRCGPKPVMRVPVPLVSLVDS